MNQNLLMVCPLTSIHAKSQKPIINKLLNSKQMRVYLFFYFLMGYSVMQAQPIILPPTQTDEIIIDNGATGKADPNDRIRYKVTIQNTGSGGANGT